MTRMPCSLNHFLIYIFGCIDQDIVLHKYKVVSIVRYHKILKKGKVRVGGVPMLL